MLLYSLRMTVIPAINCFDRECLLARVQTLKSFLPSDGWVHLDISDARFTFNKSWGSPDEWKSLGLPLNLEVHLMVEEPENAVEGWIRAGAKRIIVHLETVANFDHIAEACRSANVELMLAASPETPQEAMRPYLGKVKLFQVLAVHPGFSGQMFLPLTLGKVRFLREAAPHARIEVDGGINFETAKMAKSAGADIVAAASSIFGSDDPKLAYTMLTQI